jgi:hypothetical protein
MRKATYYLIAFILFSNAIQAQQFTAIVADEATKKPIADVFVFLANSSIGTTSNEEGIFTLKQSYVGEGSVLVFSHLNYELLSIELDKAQLGKDTFFLTATNLNLTAVEVVKKKSSRLRTRRLKRFKDAFLGKERRLVKIINPDIILFKEEDNQLIAEARSPLEIENKRLGYKISFYLEDFKLDNDTDDLFYKGNAFFQELKGKKKELAKFKRNRKKYYEKTSRIFFVQLVEKRLKKEDYDLGFSALNSQREFVNYEPITLDSLEIKQSEIDKYIIKTKGYFTVISNLNNPKIQGKPSYFSQDIENKKREKDNRPVSYLKSKTNEIIVNKYGRILNPLEIEEYGHWAEYRVAAMLPFDYLPRKNKGD